MPILQVRITDDEHARLKGWSKTQGVSISALVKQKVFNSEGPLPEPDLKPARTPPRKFEAPTIEVRNGEKVMPRPVTKPPKPSPPPKQTTYIEFRPAPKVTFKKK